jgi:hypothetical protein
MAVIRFPSGMEITTFPPAPAAFDALKDDEASVALYGFPRRPVEYPELLRRWERAVSRITHHLQPTFLKMDHVWRYGDHPDDEWLEDQHPDPFARSASRERAMMQALNRRLGAACPACNVCAGKPVEIVRQCLEHGLEINLGTGDIFESYFRSSIQKAASALKRYLADNPSEHWPLEV